MHSDKNKAGQYFRLWVLALLQGCAWGPGQPFAELSPTFRAEYVIPQDRQIEGGWARLNTDYQVRLDEARLHIDEVALFAGASGCNGQSFTPTTFDPANPPPGYSLCHNGHCHTTDGNQLVPYEEVEAQLSGRSGPTVARTLPLGDEVQLLTAQQRSLTCSPGCDLDAGELTRAQLRIRTVHIRGTVRDTRNPARIPGEQTFQINAVLDPASGQPGSIASGSLCLPADRGHPPYVDLEIALLPSPALFDDLEWSTLSPQGGVFQLDGASNPQALQQFLGKLSEVPVSTNVERSLQP